ncbi:hypothetical protein, conserved [Trypanosoma brucei gambiense DAL972]|uniref:Leucine-rich repeat protein (LRRP) n=1 Tax=Trypanosoma brucei gambiense (strain MHOM/CI/86/DAL972) TaxID=679716 RepID=C9ZVW5_TRYB9|nr:hypothetical protein, conserved [Trypanosoma brucei gambiense DAL972]CBH13553.1 hypothetical protein, conserved [Trypanosoma brucei gambiense DAL972]|eukprot:XP_011775830.1 hypothetical protein, conserved [Trypanosoma brucei gambiense DAL972]
MRGLLSHNIGAMKHPEYPRTDSDASYTRPLTMDSARAASVSGSAQSGLPVVSSMQRTHPGSPRTTVAWDRRDANAGKAEPQTAIDMLATALLQPSPKAFVESAHINRSSTPKKVRTPPVKHGSPNKQGPRCHARSSNGGTDGALRLKATTRSEKPEEVPPVGTGCSATDGAKLTTDERVLIGRTASDLYLFSKTKTKGGRSVGRQRKRLEGQASEMTIAGKRVCVHEKTPATSRKDQLLAHPNMVMTTSNGSDSQDSSQTTDSRDGWWEEGKGQVVNPLSVTKLKVHQSVDDGDTPLPISIDVMCSTPDNSEEIADSVSSVGSSLCSGTASLVKGQMDIIPNLTEENGSDQGVSHRGEDLSGEVKSKESSQLLVGENGVLDAQRRLSSVKKASDFRLQSAGAKPPGKLVATGESLRGAGDSCESAAHKVEEISKKTMEVLDQVRNSCLTVAPAPTNIATGSPPAVSVARNPSNVSSIKPISCGSAGCRKNQEAVVSEKTSKDLAIEEQRVLMGYLSASELDLSMSTFKQIGCSLRVSKALRVLNLKGCTASEKGLCGLSEVESLEVVCVSHMRNLTSLTVLATRQDGLSSNIREIDARCSSVTSAGLSGLDKMTCLSKLNLSLTPVTSVSLLGGSTSLMELNLSGTAVTSDGLLGLEKIPSLTTLNLSRTKVKSLQKIAESQTLENLNLYSCRVDTSDVRGVECMPRLKSLDFSTTKVSDLSFLSSSPSLKTLRAQWLTLRNCGGITEGRYSKRNISGGDTKLFDFIGNIRGNNFPCWEDPGKEDQDVEAGVCGLAKIPTLEFVDLSYSSVSSVRSLFSSKSIETIVLRRTPIDDNGIKDIGQLQTLKTLVINNLGDLISEGGDENLSETKGVLVSVKDITLAFGMVILDLSFTDVYDLRMITSLKCLKELYLVETLITVDGVRGVEQLPSLRLLDISQTSVLSLDFLSEGCKALEQLFVKSNRNTSGFCIGKIYRLPVLKELDVSDTVVEDISALLHSSCTLQRFVCRWGERRVANGLTEPLTPWLRPALLDGMDALPHLESIDFTNSTLRSVTFLARSRSLRRIVLGRSSNLSNNGIGGLAQIPTLEALDLSFCPRISDVRPLVSSSSLQELRLVGTGVTAVGLHGALQMKALKLLDVTGTPAADELSGISNEGGPVLVVKGGEACSTNFPSLFRRCRTSPVVILQ